MRPLVLGTLLVAALAGCGGSDSDEDASPQSTAPPAETQPASDEFVQRLDALCKDANPQLAEINAALTKARDAARAGQVSAEKTLKTFATLLRRASATTQQFAARLRAIQPPADERAFYGALVASLDQGLVNLRQQTRAAEAQDAATLRDLSVDGSVASAKQKGLIEGHGGFRFCGQG